jgi:hypothetical protein
MKRPAIEPRRVLADLRCGPSERIAARSKEGEVVSVVDDMFFGSPGKPPSDDGGVPCVGSLAVSRRAP